MTLTLIWAEDLNHGIGLNDKLPWHIKDDLAYFKEKTLGKTIVMGNKTFDGMGRKQLPGRKTIVLTTGTPTDVSFTSNIQLIVDLAKDEDVMVVGGKSIYEQFMPFADRLLVTVVHDTYETDTQMAPVDMTKWDVHKFRKRITTDGLSLSFIEFRPKVVHLLSKAVYNRLKELNEV